MRWILRLFLLAVAASSFLAGATGPTPWPAVDYVQVRAYAWPMARNEVAVVEANGRPSQGSLNLKGVALSAAQVARLLHAQTRRATPRPQAGCYVPHNAFIFYGSAQRPVAFLEICFDCLGSRLSPPDAECDPDFIELAKICAELKLPFGRFKSLAEFRAVNAPVLGVTEK